MKLTGLRRAPAQVDAVVLGRGLPALATALELAGRGASVAVVEDAASREWAPELGLMLLGPGRPYLTVAKAIGRPAAQLLWAAGCENHLRLKAFLDQAARPCGYVARGSFLLARDRRDAEDLAQSEDMLRDDGFPGEFLDHYMIETRFDVTGFPGAYWAAEDAEIAPLLRPQALGRLSLSPLAGATLPGALRTADGRIAWQSSGASVLLAETGARPHGSGADLLLDFASRLPLEAGSARVQEEAGEVSLDGLPVVGRLTGRPLAVACGFSRLSPGLAFAAARWVADALLRGTDPTPDALRPTRQPIALGV